MQSVQSCTALGVAYASRGNNRWRLQLFTPRTEKRLPLSRTDLLTSPATKQRDTKSSKLDIDLTQVGCHVDELVHVNHNSSHALLC